MITAFDILVKIASAILPVSLQHYYKSSSDVSILILFHNKPQPFNNL